jgi:hypothetical protein
MPAAPQLPKLDPLRGDVFLCESDVPVGQFKMIYFRLAVHD